MAWLKLIITAEKQAYDEKYVPYNSWYTKEHIEDELANFREHSYIFQMEFYHINSRYEIVERLPDDIRKEMIKKYTYEKNHAENMLKIIVKENYKMNLDDMEFDELLDKYIDQEKIWRTEGSAGVKNLANITRALGYTGVSYTASPKESLFSFLEDNPGAVQAVIEWIMNNGESCEDWKNELKERVVIENEEETDE